MLQHLPKVKKIILIICFIIKVSTPIYGQPCLQGDVLGVGDITDMCDILIGKTVLAHKETYYDSPLT